MRVLTTEGMLSLDVDDERDRTLIGEHHNAIRRAMEGDLGAVRPFAGRVITGRDPSSGRTQRVELEADVRALKRWYLEGELDYEAIYESS